MAKKKTSAKGKKKGGASGDSALREEELRKKREEDLRQLLKERHGIEEKNGKLNSLKIQNQWRTIMRTEKSEQIRKDLSILQQTHERQVDRKNSIIISLERDLEEAEEQYQTALQAHLQNVDNLISLHMTRLSAVETQFDQELNSVETEFNTESDKLTSAHRKEKQDLLGIMSRMEQEFVEAESEGKQEFQSLRDDVKNKNLEEKHALRIQLEGTIEDLWRQFQTALNNYNSSTEERKQQFEMLKTKDQNSAKIIEQQMRKLQRLQENISQLKTKLSNNAREYEERNKALKEEKEAIQGHFQELKKKMNTHRDEERRRLTDLTLMSSKAIKNLTSKVELAEKIIKLAEMNRALETEQEKVLPFAEGAHSVAVMSQAEKELEAAAKMAAHVVDWVEPPHIEAMRDPVEALLNPAGSESKNRKGEDLQSSSLSNHVDQSGKAVEEYAALANFHKRFNRVNLDTLCLEKEKRSLEEENRNLRLVLKQYLNGLTVNEEVISQRNPLFVVNGKTNINLKRQFYQGDGIEHNITCLEASHIVSAQRNAMLI